MKLELVSLPLFASAAFAIAFNAGCGNAHTSANNPDAAGSNACRSDSDCPQYEGNMIWTCVAPYRTCLGPLEIDKLGVACSNDAQCGAGGLVCRDDPTVPDGGLSPSSLVCTMAVACSEDSQCSAAQVCREDPDEPGYSPSSIGPGSDGLVCSAPCMSDLDCAPIRKCESGGHCQARTCAECPSYFPCSAGSCVIPGCATDADCPGGYCVDRSCAGSLGVCQLNCD